MAQAACCRRHAREPQSSQHAFHAAATLVRSASVRLFIPPPAPPSQEARVMGALLGHTDRVACVHWLPAAPLGLPPSTAALASGGGDGTVRLWLWSPATPGQPWHLCATLQGHTTPVTSLASLPAPGGSGLLLVSTAGDGDVLVWGCGAEAGGGGVSGVSGEGGEAHAGPPAALRQEAWRLRQRVPLGHVLQDCAALAPLPADPSWLLLALGGVDGGVRLYLAPPGGDFALACCLAGHQDWVKSLAWAQLDGERRVGEDSLRGLCAAWCGSVHPFVFLLLAVSMLACSPRPTCVPALIYSHCRWQAVAGQRLAGPQRARVGGAAAAAAAAGRGGC